LGKSFITNVDLEDEAAFVAHDLDVLAKDEDGVNAELEPKTADVITAARASTEVFIFL